jgi:DNA-binding transcriptional MerR regulator
MKDDRLSIGRVSQMVKLPSSVLRYWESVFEQLQPEKTPGGTRKYTMQDVQEIMKIKDLLYNKKYTIAGAKVELQLRPAAKISEQENTLRDYVVTELENIIHDLDHGTERPRQKKK